MLPLLASPLLLSPKTPALADAPPPLTRPQPHDAIDLTDNDIQVLGNVPLSPRLQTLLLGHNRISSIQDGLAKALPNLTNLVLAANHMAELADLDVLARFPRLTHLVLADNPVTKKEVSLSRACPVGMRRKKREKKKNGLRGGKPLRR